MRNDYDLSLLRIMYFQKKVNNLFKNELLVKPTSSFSVLLYCERNSQSIKGGNRMENMVEVRELQKVIGKNTIIDNLSFSIRKGEIIGLVGPNGAGKTTTIRMMVGLISMNSGDVLINGHSIKQEFEKTLEGVGAIVENPEFYPYLTGRQNLLHFARMHKNVTKERMKEVAEWLEIDSYLDKKVKTYSLGMRQRLGLAQALLHNPKFLILDEPTNGLDPAGIREFRLLLKKLSHERGLSVLVSSHLLAEIEQMCDRIVVISKGKLVRVQDVNENSNDDTSSIYELQCDQAENVVAYLTEKGLKAEQKEDLVQVSITKLEASPLMKELFDHGFTLYRFNPVRKTLEDSFFEMTGGDQK
jgi:ABC-2 type transport system ATP-binding protein